MAEVTVKICGVSSVEIAKQAWDAGADYLGLVFSASSRRVTVERAQEIVAAAPGNYIGVFRNIVDLAELTRIQTLVGLSGIQCHGLAPERWIEWTKARGLIAVATSLDVQHADVWLLDSPEPGSGMAWPWTLPAAGGPYWVAGGLAPENVRDVVKKLSPAGVDVSSGVERNHQKDALLIRAFIKEAKR